MAYTDRFPIVKNFLETKLVVDCSAVDTTLYLEDVSKLPTFIVGRDYIPIVFRDSGVVREIAYVVSVNLDSGSVEVLRSQEGTTAEDWRSNTYVYCTMTAESLQRMRVNGFAPLVDGDNGRPIITWLSDSTAAITGDFTSQMEVGMAVRVLAGDGVVAPTDASIGAVHLTHVEYSGGVTNLAFQNVILPRNVSGLDLGISVASAPLYHPDAIVADNDTLTQKQNVLSVSEKFMAEIAAKDAEQDAAIVAAQSSADAAQSSADAAQSSADAAIAGLGGVVRTVNGVSADAAGNVWLSTVPTGSIIAFAQGWVPDGFLRCNGAAISRSTYANLFAHVGTIYGAGDGSTTFNLPQLADGRYIRGASDSGTYLDPGLPNIWGVFSHSHTTYDQPTRIEGAFATISAATHNMRSGDAGTTHRTTDFNAARSNGHYGRYEDVIPRSLHMVYGIKY